MFLSSQSVVWSHPGSHHAQIEVIQRGSVRYLRFGPGGGWQGAMDLRRPSRPFFPYQRAFATVLPCFSNIHRFMALGVGTGTCLVSVHDQFPNCELYGVDIDETVVDVAVRYFGAPSHRQANYWIGDGVAFLCHVDLSFDLIFVDAYLGNQVYSPCLDTAFVDVLYSALSDTGVAAANLISTYPPYGRVREFVRHAQAVFPYVHLLPVGMPFGEQNMLAVFSKQPFERQAWRCSIRRHPAPNLVQRLSWPLRLS